MSNIYIKYLLLRIMPVVVLICVLTCVFDLDIQKKEEKEYLDMHMTEIIDVINSTKTISSQVIENNKQEILSKLSVAAEHYDEYKIDKMTDHTLIDHMHHLGVEEIYVYDKIGNVVFNKTPIAEELSKRELFTDALFNISSISEMEKNDKGQNVCYAATNLLDNTGVIIIAVLCDDMAEFESGTNYDAILEFVHKKENEYVFIMNTESGEIIAETQDINNDCRTYIESVIASGESPSYFAEQEHGDFHRNGESYQYLCRKMDDLTVGYMVVRDSIFERLGWEVLIQIFFLIMLLTFTAMLSNAWIEKNVLSGLKKINDEIHDMFVTNKFNSHIKDDGLSEEFSEVYTSINTIIDKACEAYQERDKILDENKFLLEEQERLLQERQMVIEMVENSNADAMNENKVKNEFIAHITGKIQIPMNMIISICEIVLLEPIDKETRLHIIDIKVAAHNLISMLNDIMDMSRIESGKFEIIAEPYHTKSFINNIVSACSMQLKKKEVELKVDVDSNLPLKLHGDKVRIHQMITNILNFSIQSTKRGYIGLAVRCEKKSAKKIKIIVNIADTGMGIKSKELENLFDAYQFVFSGSDEQSEYINKTALGISKRLAVMMEGDVEVKSRYGHGTTFELSFIQDVADENTFADDTQGFNAPMLESMNLFSASKAKVLIMDSNNINVKIMSSLLKIVSIFADVADNAEKALALIEENKYDMIFVAYPNDSLVDGVDCIEFVDSIRRLEKDYCKRLPVVAMTADTSTGLRNMFAAAGINDTVHSPIDPVVLANCLKKFLPEELIEMDEAKQGNGTEDIFIDGINTEKGLENCGDNIEVYLDYLKIFIDSIDNEIKNTEMYKNNDDFKNYKLTMHNIRLSADNIGAEELANIAETLEDAAGEFNGLYIATNTSELNSRVKRIKTSINNYLNKLK